MREAFQTAVEGGASDGLFGIVLIREEHPPAWRLQAQFLGDFDVITAATDLRIAHEQVRDLDGGDDEALVIGVFRAMMEAGGFDHQLGQVVVLEIKRAEFIVTEAENFLFDGKQVALPGFSGAMNLREMIGKGPGHDDFTHIVDEAGDVVGFVIGRLHDADNFTSEYGRADAVLPKIAPGKSALAGETLKVLDDGGDHRELADLPDAEVENGFFDAIYRC